MHGYPQFSFWILIALAKICFFSHGHKPCKNVVVLVGKCFKKLEYLGPDLRYTKCIRSNTVYKHLGKLILSNKRLPKLPTFIRVLTAM